MINTSHPVSYYWDKIYGQLELILLPIILFFCPIKGILITVGAVIALDTGTGIWKALKNKTPLTSRGASALISKLLLYQATMLVTYCLDFFILGEIFYKLFTIENLVTKIVALILISIEVTSINENYKAVRGRSLWQALKNMLARAKEIKNEFNDLKK